MRCWRFWWAPAAILLANAGPLLADFTPSHIVVNHLVDNSTATQVLNLTNPPQQISTMDNGNGVTATLRGPILRIHSSSGGTPNPNPVPFPPFLSATNAGALTFVADLPFTLSGETASSIGHTVSISVKNKSSNQTWSYGSSGLHSTLPPVAPAGEYLASWSHYSTIMQSRPTAGWVTATLTTVPEPAMGATMLAALLPWLGRSRMA